jgi:hypothetical protein
LPKVPSSRPATIAFFVALLASALVLGPALAHVLELPNKIDLPREEYFIVQKAYRGWNQIAWVLGVQVIAQGLFWTFTYPANVATENWTVVPDNWDGLRRHWEYSHAAGAAVQLLGFCLLASAALLRKRR